MKPPGGAGVMDVALRGRKAKKATIVLEPFFDIRFMYDQSRPDLHRANVDNGMLSVSVGDRTACRHCEERHFHQEGQADILGVQAGLRQPVHAGRQAAIRARMQGHIVVL